MLQVNKAEAHIFAAYPTEKQSGMGRRHKKRNRQQQQQSEAKAATPSESAVQPTPEAKTSVRQDVPKGESATSGAKAKTVEPQEQLTAEKKVAAPAQETRQQKQPSPAEVKAEPGKRQRPPKSAPQVNAPVEKLQQPPQASTQFVRGGYQVAEPRDWCQVCGERFSAPSDCRSMCEACAANHPDLMTLTRFQIFQYFLEKGILLYYRRGIGVFEIAKNF